MMKTLRCVLLFMALLLAPLMRCNAASHGSSDGKVDVKGVIFGHIKDSYEWHMTTIGDKHVTICLPVIVYSEKSGWNLFSSGVFHEQEEYKGFRISVSGDNEGKIVEVDEMGNEQRPFIDISITKNVLAVFINALLLVLLVLYTARWYKRNDVRKEAPQGSSHLIF